MNTNNMNTIIATMINNTPKTNGMRYLEIPLAMLEVHPTVQRDRKGHERKIAAAWDDAKCGCILVSYRDNRLLIIDGQHRYWAAQMLRHDTIACRVVEGLTEKDEALLFGRQDENKVRLTTTEKLKALVIGEDNAVLTLKRICDEFKITLVPERATDSPRLKGIRSAQLTLQRYGETALRWMFQTIEMAGWRDVPSAYGEDMIVALRNVYTKYGDDKAVRRVIAKHLKGTNYVQLTADAHNKYIGHTTSRALSALFNDIVDDALNNNISAIHTTTDRSADRSPNFEVVA